VIGLGAFAWVVIHPIANRLEHNVSLTFCVAFMALSFFFNARRTFLLNRWLEARARRIIKTRTGKLFDPDTQPSHFVAVMPKSHWDDPNFYNAADVGFLSIDPKTNSVLFEGDNGRYRLPAAAISNCGQEYSLEYTSTQFLAGYGSRTYSERRNFFFIITAQCSNQTAELPFVLLTGKGFWRQDARGAANLELIKEIDRLRKHV
jgi:hypothetical protein